MNALISAKGAKRPKMTSHQVFIAGGAFFASGAAGGGMESWVGQPDLSS
jgi:hypothetical protein